MNRLACLAVLLVVATTLLVPALAAATPPAAAGFAATQVAAQPDGPVTFGIRTATATAPDTRGRFVIGVTTGAVVKDYVAVNNVSTQPLTLRVYAADAFNTPEGGFDIHAAGRPSRDLGSWISLERDSVTVPGGGVEIVPLRVTVPADATPGDHAAGIVASLLSEQTETDGSKVSVDTRVGVRMYLRVAGELRPQLSVEGVESVYHDNYNPAGAGSATVRYTVRNAGNVRLTGSQTVAVTMPWGSIVDADELRPLPELLPGNAITMTANVPRVVPAVLSTANIHLGPAPAPGDIDPGLPNVVVDDSFFAVPWVLLGILLLITLFVLRRRRRRAVRSRTDRNEPVEVGV